MWSLAMWDPLGFRDVTIGKVAGSTFGTGYSKGSEYVACWSTHSCDNTDFALKQQIHVQDLCKSELNV